MERPESAPCLTYRMHAPSALLSQDSFAQQAQQQQQAEASEGDEFSAGEGPSSAVPTLALPRTGENRALPTPSGAPGETGADAVRAALASVTISMGGPGDGGPAPAPELDVAPEALAEVTLLRDDLDLGDSLAGLRAALAEDGARPGPLGTLDLSRASVARLDAALAPGSTAARLVAEGSAPPELVRLRGTAAAVRALRWALLNGSPEDARLVVAPLAEALRSRAPAAAPAADAAEDGVALPDGEAIPQTLAPEAAAEVSLAHDALQLLAARRDAVAALQVRAEGAGAESEGGCCVTPLAPPLHPCCFPCQAAVEAVDDALLTDAVLQVRGCLQ